MRSGPPLGAALLCVGALGPAAGVQRGVPGPGGGAPGGPATPPARPLWTYWGSAARPALVDLCVETLRRRAGPDWEVRVLSKQTALEHVAAGDLPPAFPRMAPSFQADALRLALLRRHGGMWVDATTIAVRNFSEWVGQSLAGGSGFYGFYIDHYTAPEGPPLVASWALAVAAPEEPLVAAWHQSYLRLWANRSDAEDITADPFFDGADLSHMSPFMQDYLNVELVLLALLQRDSDLRSRFDSTATVVRAESGPYAIQFRMGMKWWESRCRPVTARLTSLPAELQRDLSATALVKLRHQDRRFLERMSAAQLLRRPDSVLGSLLLGGRASAGAAPTALLDSDVRGGADDLDHECAS